MMYQRKFFYRTIREQLKKVIREREREPEINHLIFSYPPPMFPSILLTLISLHCHISSHIISIFLSTSFLTLFFFFTFLFFPYLPAENANASCVGAWNSKNSAASTHRLIARTGIYLSK